ncbi:hypothetical protein E3Q08_04147 [Wallemia mellicola]|uniref:Cation/H+ exchanger transmembrane domain-containing protein n=1 Tax=Wallemia mellicola TaxID=1708541 RepID=A0A4T0RGI7_9BASI|nr:hypothetical protein E3Q21_04103 [Wallemia mellicola]TIB83649.1 hypothetical protein E3Q20_04076 [Wallemia mellicola]TIC27520.1 hypothetical protein E3Q11_02289 [Wallemia mellicola]TIC31223.1 hypothetical protein E3Q09_04100 [Wallemia mellicola]TIC36954.1 hypothetical protein E3Q08_04147 [Wallemia mellicola]
MSYYGLLAKQNPLNDETNPVKNITVFLLQLIIIIILCRILSFGLKYIKQPPVVGEIIAGILLGPTAFGAIPNFTETVFGGENKALLTLTSNVGLSLFLFLVGLETDIDLMKRLWKETLVTTIPGKNISYQVVHNSYYIGLLIPFGVAVGVSVIMYREFADPSINFIGFFLFIATSMAVTALSILSRILVELNIIATKLGAIAIAAGVCNDALGYILLAISTAVSSGGDQLNALWELLCLIGLVIFCWFVIRHVISYFYRRNEYQLTTGIATMTIVGALISSWFTDILGLHPMVGAFAFGACCPHEHDFPEKMTEKIETPVMIFLLPLYFVASGLNTNFILLDSGKAWGLIFLLLVATFISKGGCTAVSCRLVGLPWRQAMCVAFLMQSKGVIELVILSVGLELGVISELVYAQLVMVFILTTLTVRPLADWVYLNRIDLNAHPGNEKEDTESGIVDHPSQDTQSIVMVFNTMAPPLSPALKFISLLSHSKSYNVTNLHLHAIEVTSRAYIVRATAAEYLGHSHMNINSEGTHLVEGLTSFQRLSGVKCLGKSTSLLAERDDHVRVALEYVNNIDKNGMLITPWIPSGSTFGTKAMLTAEAGTPRSFAGALLKESKNAIGVVIQPLDILVKHTTKVAKSDRKPKIILPYFGGKDDETALEIVKKMAANDGIDAHIIKFKIKSESEETKRKQEAELNEMIPNNQPKKSTDDTLHGQVTMVAPGIQQSRGLSYVFNRRESHDVVPSTEIENEIIIEVEAENIISSMIDHLQQVLVDGHSEDMLIVGRGKLDQQRTSLFRSQADDMLNNNKYQITNDELNEIKDLGRVLGSVAQTLTLELGCMYNRNEAGCPQMLVVQSSTDKEQIESPPNDKEDDQDNKYN